jgi:hypothetical protein
MALLRHSQPGFGMSASGHFADMLGAVDGQGSGGLLDERGEAAGGEC